MEREATRRAIIDAARNLVAQHGDALTLSAVAAEIGFSRATIYGYFAGKRDLLRAVAGEPPEDVIEEPLEEQPEDEAPNAPAQTIIPEPDAPSQSVPEISEQPLSELVAATLSSPTVEERKAEPVAAAPMLSDESRQWHSAQVEKIAKALVLPEGTPKEGTDAALARLGARARALEAAINDAAKQHSNAVKDSADKRKADLEALQQLRTSFQTADGRQQTALAEVRFSIHNLATRIDEIGRRLNDEAPDGERPVETDVLSFVPVIEADPAPTETEANVSDAEESAALTDDAPEDYLSAARRLMQEGSRTAEEQRIHAAQRHQRRQRRYAIVIAVAVLVTGVSIFFSLRTDLSSDTIPEPTPAMLAQAGQTMPHGPKTKAAPAHPASRLERIAALASKGNAKAQLIAGVKFLHGDGVQANPANAARWLERAADQGEPIAQNLLGKLYESGHGVTPNPAVAMRWYEASAMQGDIRAIGDLAIGYATGLGGPKDLGEAAMWFSRAANLGEVDAQFNLAVLFERGDGVPQSLFDAYKWYAIAAKQGDKDAAARAKVLAAQLSTVQLRAAQKAAAAFAPLPKNSAANDMPTLPAAL